MNWISVKERLPGTARDVLITDGDEGYIVGFYDGDWNCSYKLLYSEREIELDCVVITHWAEIEGVK